MKQISTVKDQWDSYVKAVFTNVEISPLQYHETQKAFYAGFLASIHVTCEEIGSIDDEEQGGDAIVRLCEELKEFGDKMFGLK